MSSNNITAQPDRVDVRGPRFAAWITTAVLVVALIVSAINPLTAAIVLGLQALVFAIGAVPVCWRNSVTFCCAALTLACSSTSCSE